LLLLVYYFFSASQDIGWVQRPWDINHSLNQLYMWRVAWSCHNYLLFRGSVFIYQ